MDRPINRLPGSICEAASSALAAVLLVAALATDAALGQSATQPGSAAAPATQPAGAGQASAPQSSKGAQTAQPAGKGQASASQSSKGAPAKSTAVRNLPSRFAGRAGMYYKVVWGVDSLMVKWTESGEVIRFSWRVLDPQLAKVLNDKKAEPSLIDPQAGVSLVVPTMEKIGQLRQVQTPEVGRSYWMAFSNKGRLVKRGDRVDVVVGPFRAQGLVVD
jgi:hypothetical protein